MKDLSIKKILSLSWGDIKKNLKFISLVVLLFIIISFIDGFYGYDPEFNPTNVAKNITLFIKFISIYLTAGLIIESLKVVDNKKPSLKNILLWPKSFWGGSRFILGYILYSTLIFLPILLVGLYMVYSVNNGGVYVLDKMKREILLWVSLAAILILVISFFLNFAYYFLAEGRYGVWKSIQKSFIVTKNNWKKVLVYYLVWILIFMGVTFLFGIIVGFLSSFLEYIPNMLNLVYLILVISFFLPISLFIISFGHLYRDIDDEVKKIEE